MTTYNTGNPVPSGDGYDRFDNTQTLDEVVSGPLNNYTNRIGARVLSLKGMENSFNEFLASSAFETQHLIYTPGEALQVERPTQLIDYDGSIYRVKMPASFPVLLSGNWTEDQALLVDVADASLRQDLAAGVGGTVNSDGVFIPSNAPGYVGESVSEAVSGFVRMEAFGAVGDGVTDDTNAYIQAAAAALAANAWLTGTKGRTYVVGVNFFSSDAKVCNIKLKSKASSTNFNAPITIDGRVTPKANMMFFNVIIDGNRLEQTNVDSGEPDPMGGTGSEDGGRHGFRILGHVDKLYIWNCEANNCATDGIGFFSNVVAFPAFTNIYVARSTFNGNRRHGGAIDSTFEVKFIDCIFRSNGRDLNTTSPLGDGARGSRQLGSLYGNGFDAESYGLGTQCTNLTFENCLMTANSRSGLLILPNGDGVANPAYRLYTNIKVIGGQYDEGYEDYEGKASICVVALNMTSSQRGVDTLDIVGSALNMGLLVKNVRDANIRCRIDSKTPSGVHAGIFDSDNIYCDVSSAQPAVYEIVNASVANTRQFTGSNAPGLSADSGCTLTDVSSVRISGSRETGVQYRVSGGIILSGGASFGILSVTGGREIAKVEGTYIQSNNNNTGVFAYSSAAGKVVFKPADAGQYTFDSIITVF